MQNRATAFLCGRRSAARAGSLAPSGLAMWCAPAVVVVVVAGGGWTAGSCSQGLDPEEYVIRTHPSDTSPHTLTHNPRPFPSPKAPIVPLPTLRASKRHQYLASVSGRQNRYNGDSRSMAWVPEKNHAAVVVAFVICCSAARYAWTTKGRSLLLLQDRPNHAYVCVGVCVDGWS